MIRLTQLHQLILIELSVLIVFCFFEYLHRHWCLHNRRGHHFLERGDRLIEFLVDHRCILLEPKLALRPAMIRRVGNHNTVFMVLVVSPAHMLEHFCPLLAHVVNVIKDLLADLLPTNLLRINEGWVVDWLLALLDPLSLQAWLHFASLHAICFVEGILKTIWLARRLTEGG